MEKMVRPVSMYVELPRDTTGIRVGLTTTYGNMTNRDHPPFHDDAIAAREKKNKRDRKQKMNLRDL